MRKLDCVVISFTHTMLLSENAVLGVYIYNKFLRSRKYALFELVVSLLPRPKEVLNIFLNYLWKENYEVDFSKMRV